jgi:hypothetical protein
MAPVKRTQLTTFVPIDLEHASWHFLAKEALKATLPYLSPVDNLPLPVGMMIID